LRAALRYPTRGSRTQARLEQISHPLAASGAAFSVGPVERRADEQVYDIIARAGSGMRAVKHTPSAEVKEPTR
jgi:hypothetical protein